MYRRRSPDACEKGDKCVYLHKHQPQQVMTMGGKEIQSIDIFILLIENAQE